MLHRLINTSFAPCRSLFSSSKIQLNTDFLAEDNTIKKLRINLQNIKSKIQSQIDKLPIEIEDGTTFPTLYQGVLSTMKELIYKTDKIINDLDKKQNVDLDSISSAYKYIDQISKDYIDQAITSKNNQFKERILTFDMKLGVVLNLMDKIIYPDQNLGIALGKERTKQLLAKHSQIVNIGTTPQQIQNQVNRIRKVISATNAAVIYGQNKYKHPLQRNMMFFVNVPRSIYYSSRASSISIQHYKKPDIQNIVKIWNTGQSGWKAYFLALGLRLLYPVKTSQMIYIPRRTIDENEVVCDLLKNDEDRTSVRVLIDKQEPIHQYQGTDDYHSPEPYDAIIIHIHGGGFVALSSLTSESYTRRWARQTKLPVFSINYRLAPDHPFPSGLEDVYHSYLFIINQIHKYSNIRFKKVILAGDSAGGNLVCALTAMLMKNNQPVPDALFLAYPALDLRFVFSQSRIHSFSDPLLFSTMLMSARGAYIGNESDQNPLVSPILLTQKFVKGEGSEQWPADWPKTRIMVGNLDPLYDDSLRLVDKLDRSNVDVKMSVIQGLGHAFLNLDIPIPSCKIAIQKSISELKDLSKQ